MLGTSLILLMLASESAVVTVSLLDRKYHKQYKRETLADVHQRKLDVVITTYETCRDNIVRN